MTEYEQWLELCKTYNEAGRQMRAAISLVTTRMQIGALGRPSLGELNALDLAKDQLENIKLAMEEFIALQFQS